MTAKATWLTRPPRAWAAYLGAAALLGLAFAAGIAFTEAPEVVIVGTALGSLVTIAYVAILTARRRRR